MKQIFNYSPDDGRYIQLPDDAPSHIRFATESPLEKGVYHIPAFATDIEPPNETDKWPVFVDGSWLLVDYITSKPIYSTDAGLQIEPEFGKALPDMAATDIEPPIVGDKQVAVFEAGAWVIKPDWRNTKLYSTTDGSDVSINEIGVIPKDVGATDKPRPDETYSWKSSKWALDAQKVAEKFEAQKMDAILIISSIAQIARQKIAGTSDSIEVSAWSNKLRIAQAILSNGAIDSEVAAFQAEISLRNISGETLESFCQRVLANAASYSMVCAVLDGLKRSTQDTINAAQTKEEIDAAIEQMRFDIKTKLGV